MRARLLLSLALVLGVAGRAQAVVAVEARAFAAAGTVSITPAGSDRVLYAVVTEDTNIDQNFTCNFNTSESLTQLAETAGTGQYQALFRLIAPSATTADLVCTGADSIGAWAVSGVDQTTPNDSIPTIAEQSTNAFLNCTAVTSESGDWVFAGASINGTMTGSTASGVTESHRSDVAAHSAAIGDVTGTSSVSGSWATFPGNRRASCIAFNVNQVAGAAATTKSLLLLGIGHP